MINLTADYIFTNDKCLILPLLIHWFLGSFTREIAAKALPIVEKKIIQRLIEVN
jgi:hypothetical protein